jgi:hypothetical protein
MSHGENAEKRGRPGYEYGGKRVNKGGVGGYPTPGPFTKAVTHRLERRTHCRVCSIEIPPNTGRFCDLHDEDAVAGVSEGGES